MRECSISWSTTGGGVVYMSSLGGVGAVSAVVIGEGALSVMDTRDGDGDKSSCWWDTAAAAGTSVCVWGIACSCPVVVSVLLSFLSGLVVSECLATSSAEEKVEEEKDSGEKR